MLPMLPRSSLQVYSRQETQQLQLSMSEYGNKLQIKYDILNIKKILADRSINPSCQDVQCLFQKWPERYINPESSGVMFERLSLEIKQFNEIHASNSGKAFLQ